MLGALSPIEPADDSRYARLLECADRLSHPGMRAAGHPKSGVGWQQKPRQLRGRSPAASAGILQVSRSPSPARSRGFAVSAWCARRRLRLKFVCSPAGHLALPKLVGGFCLLVLAQPALVAGCRHPSSCRPGCVEGGPGFCYRLPIEAARFGGKSLFSLSTSIAGFQVPNWARSPPCSFTHLTS